MRRRPTAASSILLLTTALVSAGALFADPREEPRSRPGSKVAQAPSTASPAPPAAHPGTHRPPRVAPRRTPVHTHSGGWYVGWGSGWWGPGWPYYWGASPYWYGPQWGYTRVYPSSQSGYGALDIDISPERAEVWVDGERLGVADDFDGFPTYLWLPKGTYDVVFYLPGFRTLARQYSIYPGLVIDVEDRLERGEAIPPGQLATTSHERRDERLRRDRENAERAEGLSWGESVGREGAESGSLDARSDPGRLRLRVEPEDASVYLDGRFLGSARDLSSLRAGLLVDAGRHTVEIVRPGYEAQRREVEVAAGEEIGLDVELGAEGYAP